MKIQMKKKLIFSKFNFITRSCHQQLCINCEMNREADFLMKLKCDSSYRALEIIINVK